MADEKLTQLTSLAGAQVPTDLMYIVDLSEVLPADQSKSTTVADLFNFYNKNTTDGSFQMEGIAAPALSSAGDGKIYFDSTSNTFKVSENGGAFFNIGSGNLSGSLTAGRVPYASGATTLTDNAGLTFTPNALTIGTAASPGGLRLVGLTGNYWNLASDSPAGNRTFYFPDSVTPTQGNFLFVETFGASVNAGWSTGLTWSNTTKQLTITAALDDIIGFTAQNTSAGTAAQSLVGFTANGGAISLLSLTGTNFTTSGLYTANQLYWRGTTGITEMLFALDDTSTVFKFGVNSAVVASINATSTEGLVLGIASSLTGRVKLYNSAGATYTQISAGNAASNLNYILPAVSPTSGQFLQAGAPSGGNVTLTWATGGGGSSVDVTSESGSPNFTAITNLIIDDVAGGVAVVNSGGDPSLGVTAGTGITVNAAVNVDEAYTFAWTAAHTLSVNSTQSATTAGTTYQPSTTPTSGQYRWSPALVLNGAANSGSGSNATGFRLFTKGADQNGVAALTIEQRNVQASASWFQVAALSQTGVLSLGVASQSTGGLTLFNSAGATSTTLQAGNAASSLTFVWPVVDPTVGQILSASAPSGGVVTLSWVANGSGGTPGGSNTQLQYNNAGAFGGISGCTTDGTSLFITSLNLQATDPTFLNNATLIRTAIGTAASDGIIITNTTAAAAGAQQYSPMLRLTGNGWKTNATAASQAVDWYFQNRPVQGAANPTTTLAISSQVNAGGLVDVLTLSGLSGGATGVSITSAASGSGATIAATSSGTNESLTLAAKAAGQVLVLNSGYAAGSPVLSSVGQTGTGIGWSGNGLFFSAGGVSRASISSSGLIVSGSLQAGFAAAAADAGGLDTAFARSAAAVMRITNGSTGAGQFIVGTSTQSATAQLSVYSANSTRAAALFASETGASVTQRLIDLQQTGAVDLGGFTVGGSLALTNLGTAPTASVTNACLTYVADAAAGAAELYARNEAGFVTRLTGNLATLDTDFVTGSTTLADVTGSGIYGSLTVNVVSGKPYNFRAVLFVTADTTGGLKFAIAGSATATPFLSHTLVYGVSAGITVNLQQTAQGTAISTNGVNTYKVEIDGYFQVSVSGTITVQFAQSAANNTSTVLQGSFLQLFPSNQ